MDETTETCPCKWCGEFTDATSIKECVRCWELNRRIEYDPALAVKMLAIVNEVKKDGGKIEYDIPEELIDLMDRYQAAQLLVDKYVKQTFGFKKAKKCAVNMEFLKRKFWKGVFDLYPGLMGKDISYFHNKQKIEVEMDCLKKED